MSCRTEKTFVGVEVEWFDLQDSRSNHSRTGLFQENDSKMAQIVRFQEPMGYPGGLFQQLWLRDAHLMLEIYVLYTTQDFHRQVLIVMFPPML